jgi:hypothetical protein
MRENMTKKIRVAFIYHKLNIFLTGEHFDNTYYHFYMNALKRNEQIEMSYFPTNKEFDAEILKNNFDIILLWGNQPFGMPENIKNIEKVDIPVIVNATDVKDTKKAIKYHKKWKIDYYFDFYPKEYFYELYPQNFKYETIFFGLESSLYQNISPFKSRIKNKILNSGAVGNTKIISRIINNILDPKWNALKGYYLRTKCNELPYVDYTTTLKNEFVNDKYPLLLQKYASAIAATSDTPSIKYWEIPAAGCLTFMEITKENRGNYLGFIDNENAIFINKKNYKEKFREFLNDSENPKWGKIAEQGRKFALENFTNDKAVESLIKIMKKLI